MDLPQGLPTLIDTPSSRYRVAVTASDGRPLDKLAGSAWIINGEMFFSPNSRRPLGFPRDPEQHVHIRKTDEVDVQDLHQPLWWSERTAYLAFLPLHPDYSSSFGVLFNPRYTQRKSTLLDTSSLLNWKKLENDVIDVLNDMRGHYGFPKPEPVMTTAVSSGITFKDNKEFQQKMTRLRGWFAVWMAQLGHAIAIAQAIDNDDPEKEDEVPGWIAHLCRHKKWDQAFVSGLNSSVAHFRPSFERAGIFLRLLDDNTITTCPDFSVDFFLRYHVPVWYRWGRAEIQAAKIHSRIARLAPLPEQLQNAATFTLRSPTCQEDRPWLAFFAERKRQEPFEIRSETSKDRQSRINRTLNHPQNRTTNVFVWEQDLDGNYVRTKVSKSENASTLASFGRNQKVYNPVFNEWDCGDDMGDPDDDEDGPSILYSPFHPDDHYCHGLDNDAPVIASAGDSAPQLQTTSSSLPPTTCSASSKVYDHLKTSEIEVYPVTQTLYEYFGFVAPLPVPEEYPLPHHKLLDNEVKLVCRILGVERLDEAFIQSVLMQYCFKFLSDLGHQSIPSPAADLFDLSPDNRLYVGAAARRPFMHRTCAGWFVLDLPRSVAQVPWKLAVNHPIAALLLCRLDQTLSDYELCKVLVQRGIQFHTFSPMQRAMSRPLPSVLMPIRLSDYKFSYRDYALYLQDRERMLSSPRIRRAALMMGGIIWRIASSHVNLSEVLMGPTPSVHRYRQGFTTASLNQGETYFDDGLDETEINALCGLVYCYTGRGNQQQYLSWWPLDSTWRKDVESPFWNERLEGLVQGRLKELESGEAKPLNASEWHRRIRSASNVRRVFRRLGDASSAVFV